MCNEIKIQSSGSSYYKICCTENDCPFQIIYNLRTRINMGYYLLDSTCLNHKENCPNSIINHENTKDFQKIANQILPLFNNKIPDTESVRQCISCFNNQDFMFQHFGQFK